jgi:polyisoprenyl-teichoic acid--peptidoglycan teichoic acid transferase
MHHTKTKKGFPTLLLYLALFLLLIGGVAAAGGFAYQTARSMYATGNFNIFQPGNFVDRSSGQPLAPGETPALEPILITKGPEAKPWDGASRVNILVMGLDYRDWEAGGGPPRTDTMILLTVDPLTKTAGMLNIPRDLWVNIPNVGYERINTAYRMGEVLRLPDGGPGLAILTVEQFLGVPIHFYAQIDFFAFEKFIDEIGGIEVEVPEEITVDPLGPKNKVTLQPGRQQLDGPVSLAYARARNTENADFDRAERQQQVILATRHKILSLNMLPTLISKSPILYQDLSEGINTNMSLDQVISLAWLVPQIQLDEIKKGVIGPPEHVRFATSPDGTQDVLRPVPNKIRLLRDEIFTSDVHSPSLTGMSEEELLQVEKASLSVLNGTGRAGLAGATAEFLQEKGANVIVTGDAGQFYHYTTVIDYTGNPYTVRYLSNLMHIQRNQIRVEYNPASEMDVLIFLGADWAGNNPLP